jgi:N-acetylneuraminic acid mutarotase
MTSYALARRGSAHRVSRTVAANERIRLAVEQLEPRILLTGTLRWESLAGFLDPRSGSGIEGAAASLINGKIYVSHGFRAGDSNRLSIYDIATNTWTHGGQTAPDAAIANSELGGGLALGKHYAIGGRTDKNAVEEFDPATATWTAKAPLLTPRGGVGAASAADKIYALGGRTGTTFGSGTILNNNEVYDATLNSWTALAPMPTAVSDDYATVGVNGKIYVFGGATSPTKEINTVQIYDVASNSWSTGSPMPMARAAAMAGVIDREIAVFGGRAGNSDLATTELYDPATDSWSSGPDMLQPVSEVAQGVTYDASGVYAIGAGIFGVSGHPVQRLTSTPVLGFPLAASSAYSAAIVSVFDHTMLTPYRAGVKLEPTYGVTAFTGETATSSPDFPAGANKDLYSFAQSSGEPFVVNGDYVGVRKEGGATYLNYDSHPGYDFRAEDGTPVYADADGYVSYPSTVPGGSGKKFHALKIDHGDGYASYYLHLSSYPKGLDRTADVDAPIPAGTFVTRGQFIGYSGYAGLGKKNAAHLHFEVHRYLPGGVDVPVDPYGWSGAFADPYKTLHPEVTNVNLWDLTRTVSGSIFVDDNFDHIREASEQGLGGITVYVDTNKNDQRDSGEPFAMSDASGDYSIANVPVGDWTVHQVLPFLYFQTWPKKRQGIPITVAQGAVADVNFADVVFRLKKSPVVSPTVTVPDAMWPSGQSSDISDPSSFWPVNSNDAGDASLLLAEIQGVSTV